ncbi:4'-phosphopantetheinyl transferase [Streptomyces sp. NPDC050560]|uniref:4'-phosphopantetheinyl transferase n=1 Tax=Streptomyces sp. NPDC050560 TaxID=3365630 RepID=UPI0037900EE9
MIDALLPPDVSCAHRRDDTEAAELFPEEAAAVSKAVERRRNEYATVRLCAREAMAGLGLPPVPVLSGPRGEPVWPEGIVGSMTHCTGYRAAVLAHGKRIRALGIDAEEHGPVPEGVLEAIALPAEQARHARHAAGEPGVHWDRLLFSAKESVYKAWFPIARRMLEFEEADLVFTREPGAEPGGTFHARLLATAPGVPPSFDGRWLVRDGIVLTAICLPADTAPHD